MKKSFVLAVLWLVASLCLFGQDMNPDKTVISSIQAVYSPEHNQVAPVGQVIMKFGHDDWRWYAVVSGITNQSLKTPAPDSQIGLNVNGSNLNSYDGIVGQYTTSLGGGLSYGSDKLRFYAGLGYSLDNKARLNGGLYWQAPLGRVKFGLSAFADIASADWRYDVQALAFDQVLPNFDLGIGFYAKTDLGLGVMGQIAPCAWLKWNFGWGYDPEAKTKSQMKFWTGISLSL